MPPALAGLSVICCKQPGSCSCAGPAPCLIFHSPDPIGHRRDDGAGRFQGRAPCRHRSTHGGNLLPPAARERSSSHAAQRWHGPRASHQARAATPRRSRAFLFQTPKGVAFARILALHGGGESLRHTRTPMIARATMNRPWTHHRWLKVLLVGTTAWLALWLLAWLAVPPLVKSQLQRIASAKLGREVTVQRVDFKPWTLELDLHGLQIGAAPGAPPAAAPLQIERIHADAELQSLIRLAPVIDAVTIESPRLKLAQAAEGRWDIDDILARMAPAPDAKPGEPARFAIYNIVVQGGSVDFLDERVRRTHQVRELSLSIPFLSNLASQREVLTEPRLAFVLNGSRFDSRASTTPFAATRKTDARLSFTGLDLAPYLPYLPRDLPVRLTSGLLDADLTLGFEQGEAASLRLGGHVEARNAKLDDARGGELLSFASLRLDLTDVRPLERRIELSKVTLAAPKFALARGADGRLNLASSGPAPDVPAAIAPPTGASSAPANKASAPSVPAWRIQVDRFALQGGTLVWRDETVQPAARVEAVDLSLQIDALRWPMDRPASVAGAATIEGARLVVKGSGTERAADITAQLERLPLSLAAPYLARSLNPTLDGRLTAQVEVSWKAPELRLNARRLVAEGFALTQGRTAVASAGKFEVVDAALDLGAHTLAIGSITAIEPLVRVERGADRRWMFQQWLKTPSPRAGEGEVGPEVVVPAPGVAASG
ncbi:MAG: DUF748 domain-containing protein [Comamonadaceae bacterium]|nr:MAG: DUF748 domain-containing protein [Comamonadaceae bacterium]